MYLVAIGSAKLKHWWDNPRFAVLTLLSLRQARRSPGNRHASVFPHAGHFFSLTAWDQPAQMKAFATSGPHRRAQAMELRLTDSSIFHVYWSQTIPRPSEAIRIFRQAAPGDWPLSNGAPSAQVHISSSAFGSFLGMPPAGIFMPR